jgi:Tat protein translocase TatB subunit
MLPFGIGFSEIILIVVVLLLVVGPQKLPELAKTFGKGMRVVRKASADLRAAVNFDEVNDLRRDIRREMYKPVDDWKAGAAEIEEAVVEPFQRPGLSSPEEVLAEMANPRHNSDGTLIRDAAEHAAVEDAEVEDAVLEDAVVEAAPEPALEVSTSGSRARMQAAAAEVDDGLPFDDAEEEDDEEDDEGGVSIARHDPLLDALQDAQSGEGSA